MKGQLEDAKNQVKAENEVKQQLKKKLTDQDARVLILEEEQETISKRLQEIEQLNETTVKQLEDTKEQLKYVDFLLSQLNKSNISMNLQ